MKKGKKPHVLRWALPWDWYCVLGCVAALFLVQTWNLDIAAFPDTDEGVYVVMGQMMMAGLWPYIDFPLAHMPLFPFLVGVLWKLTGSVYAVRVLFLLSNSLAVLGLYTVMRRMSLSATAGLIAVLLYSTFHEMLHHDFRFLAIRQTANVLMILFLVVLTSKQSMSRKLITTSTLTILQTFLLLPAALNTLALLFCRAMTIEKREQKDAWQLFVLMAFVATLSFEFFIAFFPGGFEESLLSQVMRDGDKRWLRGIALWNAPLDRTFYFLGFGGLVLGSIMPKYRTLALGLLVGSVATVVLPSLHFPHYLSLAGPMLAIGACILIDYAFSLPRALRPLSTICILLLCIYHFSGVGPSLLREYMDNKNPDYHAIIDVLRFQPDPVLTLEPIFAGEAGKSIVLTTAEQSLRMPWNWKNFSSEEKYAITKSACTILMERKTKDFLPAGWRESLRTEWIIVYENPVASILRSRAPECNEQRAS